MKKIINIIILVVVAVTCIYVSVAIVDNDRTNNDSSQEIIDHNNLTTPTVEKDEYNPAEIEKDNIKVDTLCRDRTFNVGVIGHHYEYYVDEIKKVEGVYSLYKQSKDNSLEYEYEYNKTSYNSNTIYYSDIINLDLEGSLDSLNILDFKLNHVDFTSNFKAKNDYTSKTSCRYFKEIKNSEDDVKKVTFNAPVESLFSQGYNRTIGIIGTYYKFKVSYIEYENWWGKDYECSKGEFDCIIANESNMALSFVYTLSPDSDMYYYL